MWVLSVSPPATVDSSLHGDGGALPARTPRYFPGEVTVCVASASPIIDTVESSSKAPEAAFCLRAAVPSLSSSIGPCLANV